LQLTKPYLVFGIGNLLVLHNHVNKIPVEMQQKFYIDCQLAATFLLYLALALGLVMQEKKNDTI
jgi:hypothetical protein